MYLYRSSSGPTYDLARVWPTDITRYRQLSQQGDMQERSQHILTPTLDFWCL